MSCIANDYSFSLLEKLRGSIKEYSLMKLLQEFELPTKDSIEKVQHAEKLLKDYDLMPKNYDEYKLTKCNKKAEEFKNLGNQLYKEKKFYEALVSYNKSLCYSPEDSEGVGIAFANRSAVYFAIGQYEKCLENIELAKNHSYPKDKIEKLKNREEQAVENLNNCPDPNQKLIKYEAARQRFLKSKLKANGKYNFFVADCLEVKTSPEFGRYLITNQDLKVGSVIAVEKPFSKNVESKAVHERCANCLKKNLLNLLPCFNCCSAMFCSEDCRSAAQEKFHKYECGLLNVLYEFFEAVSCLALRTYFEALNICGTPSKLREFLNSIKDSSATILDFNYIDEASFRLNSLHSIDALVTNEKNLSDDMRELFKESSVCAIMCDLMLNHSKPLKAVLQDDADQVIFKKFIFKYYRTAATNSHGMYCKDLYSADSDVFGAGFYPFTSLMNHSCAANIARQPFETSFYITVTRPIKKGGQIFDNYGLHHCQKNVQDRQKSLFRRYRFKCQCEACKKDYPMSSDLKIKDQFLHATLSKDFENLVMTQDFDLAVKNYIKYCKLSDKLDEKKYPCMETTCLHFIISACIAIFTKTESYEL